MKASELIALIDHTRLEENDTEDAVAQFCQEAITPKGNCAAVCVYPQYIMIAKSMLKSTSVKVASVANFPTGNTSFKECLNQVEFAFDAGVDEIDIVIPYQELIRGNDFFVNEFIKACKRYSDEHVVKIIIESGALSVDTIKNVSQMIIDAGIEFIKTSTGKIPKGASPEAVTAILETIKKNKTKAGLKISGGVRTLEDAQNYIALVQKIMGDFWISPNSLRFGTSKLLGAILSPSALAGEGGY
jgi:deoxyribose-phosphate aldolase